MQVQSVPIEGERVPTMIDDAQVNGVASWDEDQKIVENCQGWPSMTRH